MQMEAEPRLEQAPLIGWCSWRHFQQGAKAPYFLSPSLSSSILFVFFSECSSNFSSLLSLDSALFQKTSPLRNLVPLFRYYFPRCPDDVRLVSGLFLRLPWHQLLRVRTRMKRRRRSGMTLLWHQKWRERRSESSSRSRALTLCWKNRHCVRTSSQKKKFLLRLLQNEKGLPSAWFNRNGVPKLDVLFSPSNQLRIAKDLSKAHSIHGTKPSTRM